MVLYPHTKPIFVRSYHLVVRNLNRVASYYERVIGLQKLETKQNICILGFGETAVLILEEQPNADSQAYGMAGLFHTAFLLPSRKDLAHYLKYVMNNKISLVGMADHLVSEAIYLRDPEGNGIEIYADRPHREWCFDEDGVVMDTVRLDTQDLLKIAPLTPWNKLPETTVIGHIHLQVGDIAKAENFYHDVIELDVMERFAGGSFFASGNYHHHIATNTWASHGAQERQKNLTGLKGYTLEVNQAVFRKLEQKLVDLKMAMNRTASSITFRDPWGIELSVKQ